MSSSLPPEPPTQPLRPVGPPEPIPPARVVEHEVDPAFVAQLDDTVRSMKTALALLALVTLAALGLALWALLRAEEADNDRGGDRTVNAAEVSRSDFEALEDDVQELRGDVRQARSGTKDAASEEDIAELRGEVEALQKQADEPAPEAGADEETTQALDDLREAVETLDQRLQDVEEAQQEQQP